MTNRLLQRRQMVVDVLHPNKVTKYTAIKCIKSRIITQTMELRLYILYPRYKYDFISRPPFQKPKSVKNLLKCTDAQPIVFSHLASKQISVVENRQAWKFESIKMKDLDILS